MTRTTSLLLSGLIAISILATVILTGATVSQAASTLFGGASQGPDYVTLVSDTGNATSSDDFSGVSFDDANGTTFSTLTTLSTDFNVTDDNCGAGSPRFQIRIDKNNDNVSDGNVFVYLGPSPSFTGCTQNSWLSSGNLIGNNDAGRWDFTQVGGPLGTYSQAPADVLTAKILGISIVTDSGWNAAASGGDNEQTTLIDNVAINNASYNFAPAPVTVTIVKYIDGAHATSTATSSFPMMATWNSTSTGSGSGSFALSPAGFNNPNPYEATTASMTSGASYGVSEQTSTSSGAVVGADCATGASYRLVGYSTGDSLASAASSTQSTTSPSLTNITSNKYIIVWNAKCTPTAATSSTVTIVKYVDGEHATASSSNSATFPMQATYQASNINGGNPGTDPYTIGPVGNNTANAYEAKTVLLANGASYGTFEHTNTSVVGASCNGTTTPFRLVGYSWGDTLAAAASSSASITSPSFTNLQNDKYVIVWNATCAGTTTPPTATSTVKVHVLKYVNGQKATASSTSSFQFPMSATWMASNLNGGATSSGAYVLGNNHGGAADQYGADTAAMNSGAYYTTSETTSTSSGMVLPNGAACETDKYRLLGYTTGTSFADAASKSPTLTAPSFSNLVSDQYVIVWNLQCNGSQNPPPTTSGCAASSTPAGYQRVNGTPGNDNVTLAPNTFFVGLGGNDKINAGDGNYVICTGPGNDTITLGNGQATIDAGGGNNKIKHGDGAVWITTGSGNDTIVTGSGGAHIWTNAGNDHITTGSGADVIDAGGGNNTVKSGSNNDSISSGSGNDTINGEAGTDTCVPGGGNNNVSNCEL